MELITPPFGQVTKGGGGDVCVRPEAGVKEALKDSTERGMQDFDSSLFALFRDGRVTKEEALANADSPANLEAKINFG